MTSQRTIPFVAGLLFLASPALAQSEHASKTAAAPSDFCATLHHYLDSAKMRFSDEEGEVDTPKEDDGTATFVSKTTLAGAKDCIVYHEDKPTVGPWIDCEVADTKDAAVAKVSFEALVAKVDACFPSGFHRDKGKRLDGRQDYVDYQPKADPDGAYVSVESTRAKKKATYSVVVDVTVPDENTGGD